MIPIKMVLLTQLTQNSIETKKQFYIHMYRLAYVNGASR